MDGFEHLRSDFVSQPRCEGVVHKVVSQKHRLSSVRIFFGFFSFIATPSACRGRDAGWCCSTGLFLMVHIVGPYRRFPNPSKWLFIARSTGFVNQVLRSWIGRSVKWLQELCSFLIKFWRGWHLLTAYPAKGYSSHNFLPRPILSSVVCWALNLQVLSGLWSSPTWALRGIKTSHFSWV